MLYLLEIENFYSIRDLQTIDLRVNSSVPDDPQRFDPIFDGASERAARVAAFFGPNASGKTTVLKALAFISWFIQHSFQLEPRANLPLERFNNSVAQREPTKLAIEMGGWLPGPEKSGELYTGTWRYELVIGRVENRNIIESEVLRHRPGGQGRWTRAFERHGDKVLWGPTFPLSGFGIILDKIRDNASVVSTLSQLNHAQSLAIREAAKSVSGNIMVIDRSEVSDQQAIQYYAANAPVVEALNKEISRIDLGIRKMEIESTPSGAMALFTHEGLELRMPWILESHGTRNFIKYFPWLHLPLNNGGLALIDEIDVALHPLVLPEILRWFQSPERNPKRSQLWMSCHAASLLEELVKEEVFFCEKDSAGRTSVYGLQDIQNVRRTDNRYRKYLSGVYGAVPRLG